MAQTAMTGPEYAAIRRAAGLTQRELAELVGVHPQAISKRERGVRGEISREAELALLVVIANRQIVLGGRSNGPEAVQDRV